MTSTPTFAASTLGNDFPVDGTPDEKILYLLDYAILAPSSHNTQPWLFSVQGNQFDLIADLNRSLPVCDPMNRELIMSCGAALHHMRIATRYFGYSSTVEYFPDPSYSNLLARYSLGPRCDTHPENVLLFHAMGKRHTNRFPFEPDPIPQSLQDVLTHLAAREGAWLQIFEDEESRYEIADLVAEADRVQWEDKQFRKELAHWLTPNRSPRRDGIPGYAQGLGDLSSEAEAFMVRTFDLGKGQAARHRDIALHSPALAVLGTEQDDRASWLAAGQALSAILLRARVEDVSASFLSQTMEIPSTRAALESLTGCKGAPQIVLRLGFGREVRATPRRPLKAFLLPPRNRPIRIK